MCFRSRLGEELRSRIHFKLNSLRSSSHVQPSFYNLAVNTPEFSRFVFGVPAAFLAGVTLLSVSSPNSMPLVFEKLIPYHTKTIAFSLGFISFADLAICAIGRPAANSHLRIGKSLFFAWFSLAACTGVVTVADHSPRAAYGSTLALLGLHTVPVFLLPMPSWIRAWRFAFLALSTVSVGAAWNRLNYLETHWDQLVLAY